MTLLPEHIRARHWRMGRGLSRPALAALTGYSVSAIMDHELGRTRGTGKPIGRAEMQRYRLACAAINAGLAFDW